MPLFRDNRSMRHDTLHHPLPSNIAIWSPSDDDGVFPLDGLRPAIRHINTSSKKKGDPLARLWVTWMGRFYTKHLKRYAFIRWLASWLWRNLYPVYLNFIAGLSIYFRNRKALRWRRLITLNEYTAAQHLEKVKLADAGLVKTPAPAVYPAGDRDCLQSPHEEYIFPEVFVASIKNGMVYGGTNLILLEDQVICHDLYDFKRDYTSEELHGRTVIDPAGRRIRWMLHDETPEQIPMAAAFVDACAPNYAHWMTEVLPRIALFCNEPRFNRIPIVVNDGLHRNIMESLALVAGPEREIITLPIGRALAVDTLYLTSVAGYVPFERRTTKLSGHSHGRFSPRAFELLRERLAVLDPKTGNRDWLEKIVLHRNSGYRKVINIDEIQSELVGRGFAVVQPEKLTFLQQVHLFSHVKHIVGSSGSALANMMFAPKDAKIIILLNKHPDTSYWYWQNMACACGNKISYVMGHSDETSNSGIHADFSISVECLISSIEG